MKIVPLRDKIVVKRIDPEETTAGGIVLPEAARDTSLEGKVLSVGDGRLLESGQRAAMQVQEGDRVILPKYAGTSVTVDDQELVIVSEDEVLAVLESGGR